jgi:hypothetical protein
VREQFSRILLGILAASSALVGFWAGFAPRSFYDDFPGTAHPWVSPDGPFNEHLVRDVGWFNLALALVAVIAAVSLARAAVAAAAGAAVVAGVPHLVYHLTHLDLYATGDQVANVVTLLSGPVLGVIVLGLTFWPSRASGSAKMPASTPPPLSSASSG